MAESLGSIYYDVDARTGGLLDAENQIDRSTRNIEKDFVRAERGAENFSGALGKLKAVAAGVSAALAANKVVKYADAWTNLTNRLRQVTSGQQELADVTQEVLDVANKSYTDVGATANLYSRLARSTNGLGLSQKDLLRITETINKTFAVSGATATEAENAIIQLGQGLAAGALRGDEFNSVAEQAPGILQAVSKYTGMTIGQLRAFAATGGITAKILVESLQNYSDTVDNQFSKSVRTFGQEITNANSNLKAMIGDMDGVNGAIRGLGYGISSATQLMMQYSGAIDITLGGLAGAVALYGTYRAALAAATVAQAAFNAVMNANPAVRAITIVGSLAGALYAARDATVEIGDTTQRIGDLVSAAWQISVEKTKKAWDWLSANIAKGLAWIEKTFGISVTDIDSTFSGAMASIAGYGKAAVNTIISEWRVVPIILYRLIQAAVKNIGQEWENLGNSIHKAMNFDFSGARQELTKNIQNPLDVTKQIMSDIRDEFTTDHVGNFFKGVSNGMDAISKRASAISTVRSFRSSLDSWQFHDPSAGGRAPSAAGIGKGASGRGHSRKSSLKEQTGLFDQINDLQKQYNQLVDAQRSKEEKSLDTLRERLTLISRAQIAGVGGDYDNQRSKAVDDTLGSLHSGRRNYSGGEYDNQFQRYDNDANSENQRYASQQDLLKSALDQQLITEQDYYARSEAAAQDHADNIQQIESARQSLLLSTTSSMFGDLADATRTFAGQNSALYKTMFAASKAFAIADAAVKIEQGIASAAALPFPANIPAMASVAAATGSILSTIESTNMGGVGGGRINGGSVTAGRMYPVTEDGKPEIYSDGTRNYLLPGKNGSVTSNKDMQGNGAAQVSVNVHNNGSPVNATSKVSQQGNYITVDMFLSDMANDREMSQSIQKYHGTHRRGS